MCNLGLAARTEAFSPSGLVFGLKWKFGLADDDLAIWDILVDHHWLIRCDVRIWMAHLYYETIHAKYRPGEQIAWPKPLAAWHLRNTFKDFLRPLKREDTIASEDPDKHRYDVYPALNGFASYLYDLGVLSGGGWQRHPNIIRGVLPPGRQATAPPTELRDSLHKDDEDRYLTHLQETHPHLFI